MSLCRNVYVREVCVCLEGGGLRVYGSFVNLLRGVWEGVSPFIGFGP